MASDARTFLITGGTGTTGSHLVRLLAQRAPNAEIRVGTRSPDGGAATCLTALGERVRAVRYDDADPGSIADAVQGATHVYALPPFVPPRMDEWHRALADAIESAQTVRYVVKHSVQGARLPTPSDEPSAIPQMHARGESMLRAIAPVFTALRPTIFAQHVTEMPWLFEPGGDTVYLPTGDAAIAWVDARDIAAMAARLLTLDDPSAHDGRGYTLTGPSAVSGAQMAHALSLVLERRIRHVSPSVDAYADRIAALGGPPGVINVYREAAHGHFAALTDDAKRVTGVRATSFGQFAYDHRALLA